MDRCFQLGEAIADAIRSWQSDKKVAVVASGGLSHWVPVPKVNNPKPGEEEMIELLLKGRSIITIPEDEFHQQRIDRVVKVESGPVNEEWDREFLQLITNGNTDTLRNWSTDFIEENGGNGGQEVRNWLALLGAMQGYKAEVVCYESIPEWLTGMGIVQFSKP
jgi:2,3-dihydroxyphenylpropionate 1,2-dioxygenase